MKTTITSLKVMGILCLAIILLALSWVTVAFLPRNANTHNIATHYWTINDKDEMHMLVENGADATMTDYPHKLKAVLNEAK